MIRKITLLLTATLLTMGSMAQLTFTRVWERSDSAFQVSAADANKKPSYFNDMNTRGIAVGTINSNSGKVDRVFLPSRNAEGNVVRVLDATTGADIKSLNMTGVSGGGFIISDAGMTEDGVLLVSNCTHSSSGPFKIYKWTNEDEPPTVEISFPSGAARYGDKITVTGKYSDGTARIYTIAGAALSNYKVQYFAMEQDGGVWKFKQTPDELNTAITAVSSNFHHFTPGPDNGYYFRSVGLNNFQQIKADLTANIGNTHPTTIAQGSTVPVFIKSVGNFDYACYLRYGSHATFAKPAVNQAEVVKIDRSQGISSAVVTAATPSFGNLAPGNGAGHVVVKHMSTGDADIYILSTQNGIARYRLSGSEIGTGISDPKGAGISIRVLDGELTVEGTQNTGIRIYTTSGQLIAERENATKLNVQQLKGLYIVQITDSKNLIKTQKITL
jgi:hypothetical protein